jgi:arylsulfatase A-like enzyme
MPYLTGARTDRPHELLFWRMNQRTAVRVDDWKLLRNPGRGSGKEWQLYDLSRDLEEAHDLAADEPQELQRLVKIWEQMNGQMIPPLWERER